MPNQQKEVSQADHATGSDMLLWRCHYGKVSPKPVKVTILGNDEVKVHGSVLIRQKRDGYNDSFHGTQIEAINRMVKNAEREADRSLRELGTAMRRLTRAREKRDEFLDLKNH